jgi:capsular exopolysaccharide synthesis family protein
MQPYKTPIINDEFDIAVFIQIIKKNYITAIILIIMSVISAFLYLRYTQPVYNAVSILQINETNKTTRVLEIENVYQNNDILKVIELLRSKEFLKKVFNNLDLDISYYIKGTFLSTERYKTSPFSIEWNALNQDIYDRPYFINFTSIDSAIITTYINEEPVQTHLKLNKWTKVFGGEMRYKIKNYQSLYYDQENNLTNSLYFIINNPQNLVDKHIQNLDIILLNRNAQTIQISYSCNNARKASDVVNKIAHEYLKYDVDTKKESAENILAFIEERLAIVYQDLNKTEKQLNTFKKKNKIDVGQYQNNGTPFPIFTSKVNELEDDLINIEFELIALNRIEKHILNDDNLNIYELIASLAGTRSETIIVNVLNNLQQLINQKEQLLNDVTIDNIRIKIINKQIDNQKQLLEDFIVTTISRLENKKSDYEKKIAEYEKKLFNDNGFDELEYSRLERLYSINEGFYHKLIEKKAEYLISQAGYVSQNTILEKSVTPQSPIRPIKNKTYPLFVLIGVFLGILYIVIKYLFYDEIPSTNTIQHFTNAPILGTIPVYKTRLPVSQLLVNKEPNSIFSESFRTIRSNLQFISHGAETKTISVSSTISGEGKTFVAINLAGILAISGKKVILLDLDLRKPRLHLSFDTENHKGISTLLINKYELNECIKKTDIDNLDFITAGPIPPNPAELASSKQLDELLDKLDEMYDIIIIDTPPVGIVTDALTSLQKANYPIYVMKANSSKRHFIENINNLIKNKNIDNLSVILNSVDNSGNKYGSYGYHYGYGSGYHSDEEKKSIIKKVKNKLKRDKK